MNALYMKFFIIIIIQIKRKLDINFQTFYLKKAKVMQFFKHCQNYSFNMIFETQKPL